MIESNTQPLQAISSTIDYNYFNYKYQKRKKPLLLLKEKDLPAITIKSNNNFNSINTKIKNMFKLPILSPLKTNTSIPKLKTIQPKLKNLKFQLRNKIPKKKGKLSIKYLDIINMNRSNKLFYEITKASIIEEDITNQINDPITKSKLLNELNIINDMTNYEIDNLMNTTTKEEKGLALKFLKINPKMIYLSAEEIFKEFNDNKNKNRKFSLYEKNIEEKIVKNKKTKESLTSFRDKSSLDFLLVAKNNIRRKIELRNQYNQEISIEYIDILLRNEIEKIKLIISMYLNEKQDENILFNPDDEFSPLTENRNETINKIKNIRALDKSINKIMRLNNYYNDLIRTNYGEENYRNGKIMINENTQYNYDEELNEEKNNIYNTEEKYINKVIKPLDNKELNKNLLSYKEKNNNSIEHRNNKSIFTQFKKFSRNKKSTYESISDKLNNNDIIERRTIHTNKKEGENENNHWVEKNDIKLANSKSYKTTIEKGKILSMSNKDILSIFDRTKYKGNKDIKINIKSKEKPKENLNIITSKENQLNKEEKINENIKIVSNEEENDINDNILNDENNNNNSEQNENEENEEDENNLSSENEDEDKTNENFIISQLTYKNNENNNPENNYNILLSTTEEQNNINSLNVLNGYQTQNLNKPEKKSKSKKKKKKGNKASPEKSKKSQEKSELNTDHQVKAKNRKNIFLNNDIISTNKSQNNKNKIKNQNFFRKSKITTSQRKKISSSKRRRKSIFSIEKRKKFLIKDFEILNKSEKIIKRNKSKEDIPRFENAEMNLNEQVNIIKLHEDDMDQIVNFINEEEKRRIRIKKNSEKLNREKRRKTKKSLYSLFKVKEKKEEEKDPEDLTRDDLIEKLKRDDWRIRQYIEDIIRAGLTMGNKELNKRMKNESIIIFQGFNLGKFKFKKNFGIKEEVNIEPFRPLSHDGRNKEEDSEIEEKETEKYFFKKEKKSEKIEDKNNEEKKDGKENKKKKHKKKLIYDNQYLFKKKKQSIQFILRKEIEEILQGGIFLQQLANTEEEKNIEMINRFLPKRSKFIKKKKYRGKLFRKSRFLNDFENNVGILPIKENNYSSSESEIKEESDHSFEDKIQKLINKVKKLKKGEELNLNEVERIMNQKNERNEKEKEKEIRMQGFLHTLNEYRDMNKNIRKKNDNFNYKVPIQIMANSDRDKISSFNTSKL